MNENSPNSSKKCRCFSSTLKDAFANCHTLRCRFSASKSEHEDEEEEEPQAGDCSDEDDEFVSAVISKYVESKCRRKMIMASEKFWDFSQIAGDLFITTKAQQEEDIDEEREEFFSISSHFSDISNAASMEAFLSAKTNLTRCSSLNMIDSSDFWRRSAILQFSHCQGWAFGLCRRALLLPPLPKSPSDS